MTIFMLFWTKIRAALGHPDAILALKVWKARHASIHIYGLGEIGQELINTLARLGLKGNILALYDSKGEYNPFTYQGLEVRGMSSVHLNPGDILVIASVKFEQEIYEALREVVEGQAVIGVSSELGVCAE